MKNCILTYYALKLSIYGLFFVLIDALVSLRGCVGIVCEMHTITKMLVLQSAIRHFGLGFNFTE